MTSTSRPFTSILIGIQFTLFYTLKDLSVEKPSGLLQSEYLRNGWPYLPGFTVLCLLWDLSSISTERYFNLKKRKVKKKKERKKEGGL